ncbi:peptide maturation system acyl carrier-related protein [Ruminiclostridium papyrosolvens]|uniref:Peptide maturation system acyl carrier-related protein n=1 Tax=Ruminiclostridium papyrosolvens C7 TaxID=1330534 RepID=U4R176_9FIRM|nr:peptide maturation system acyl carrier-related protein [Ruminiclostridium papyrosolvens]EPR11736.1 hypothetical protein L323_10995 [Ruminiclostridium papyrosolvens C7]
MNIEVINEKLLKIFESRFDMDLSESWEEVQDEHFLGSKMRMAPRDLLYLHSDIEKEFNIKISQEHIISGKFNSLNNIINIISYGLKEKESEVEGKKVS